ncbi:hypothetical protein KR018_003790, partial [Drosophila ironensis]
MDRDVSETYHREFLSSELRTIAILGYPVKVLETHPRYKVLVTVRSTKYNMAGYLDPRVGCSLLFICPRRYPYAKLRFRIQNKVNFPDFLEFLLLHELSHIQRMGRGKQQMVAMVKKTREMVEQMARQMKREMRLFQDAEELGKL